MSLVTAFLPFIAFHVREVSWKVHSAAIFSAYPSSGCGSEAALSSIPIFSARLEGLRYA